MCRQGAGETAQRLRALADPPEVHGFNSYDPQSSSQPVLEVLLLRTPGMHSVHKTYIKAKHLDAKKKKKINFKKNKKQAQKISNKKK